MPSNEWRRDKRGSRSNTEQLALLEQARDGDDAALEALLLAVQPQLYRFSMKMCRHTEDAEDVIQDSMMALARSFRDFRGTSSLSTWLYTVVRSFCIKKRRKSKFAPTSIQSLDGLGQDERGALVCPAPDPHEQVESAQVWEQVEAGIKRIDPSYREVLILRDIEGLKAKEVAEVVGISVSAVKSRLHRARARLRDELRGNTYQRSASCPDIRLAFSEHLEGDLSPSICSTMEAHVASCPSCAAECRGLKIALNACSTAPGAVPKHVQRKVHKALKDLFADWEG